MSRTIKGWYSNDGPTSSCNTILHDAYEEAVSVFSRELGQDKKEITWLQSGQSMEDFRKVILDAQTKYHAKPNSKARKWLGILSAKVIYYGPVLDVLTQTCQEYGSLAWGVMKFLFVAVMNHEEIISQLSKIYSHIADILPRTELTLVLYPTDVMKEAVAHLYARILRFMQHAVCWYKQGKLAHAWAAVAKPWAMSFKDYVEDIGEQARRVDMLSSTACKAELRDTHIEIRETREELRKAQDHIYQLLQVAQTTQSIQTHMQLDIRASKEMIFNIQLTQILSLPFMNYLPTSGDSLGYCQSMRLRRKDPMKLFLPDTSKLHQWATQSQTSFLITESSSRQAAKDFLVDLVNQIRTTPFPVLWALRFADFWERDISRIDILRMLLLQAIQINPLALTHGSHPITITHLREAVDEADWLTLLCRALERIPQVYIVLDVDLLGHATAHNRYIATRWLGAFLKLTTKTVMKVFVSTLTIDEGYATRNWGPESWTKLQTDKLESMRGLRRRRKIPRRRVPARVRKSQDSQENQSPNYVRAPS